MGLRGIGSKPLSKRGRPPKQAKDDGIWREPEEPQPGWKKPEVPLPWENTRLNRAGRVMAFLEDLTITSGKDTGQKLKLRPFQQKFIRAVYSEKGGRRLVRTAVLSIARKNGKTELAAGLALCHLCGPEAESRGEVYSCANDLLQAGKIFNEMVALIYAHPWLNDRCNIIRFRKQIEDLQNGSLYSTLSAEVTTKMGLNPSFVVYDELGSAAKRDLYDAMDTAMGAREEPLLLVISTQAASDHAPMSQLIDYGLRIHNKDVEDSSFHLSLYAAPEDADPWVKSSWEAANPALGDFRSLSDVERMAGQAKRMPAMEPAFRNLILNQRVASESKFINRAEWDACGEEAVIPEGAKVYAALDLGATRDLSALVLIHQDADDNFHVLPYFWLPGDVRDRSEKDRMPYELWVRKGFLTPIGTTTDPKVIANKIAELNGRYRIMTLAFDRWRIQELKRELDNIGCRVQLVEHGQGYKDMGPAVNVLERHIANHRIRHGKHPVLTMCAMNAVVTTDPAGARKLDKARSSARIDGLVALAMAFSAAVIKNEDAPDVEAMIA